MDPWLRVFTIVMHAQMPWMGNSGAGGSVSTLAHIDHREVLKTSLR
jgi:hypothetical protein